MKKWISLLTLSLVIGAGLAWIARPLEMSIRWGDRPEQSATLNIRESAAKADISPEDQRAIDTLDATSRAFVAIAKEVSPSVVTIYSERNLASNDQRGNNNRFGFPFDFFGGPFDNFHDNIPQRGMGSGVIVSSDGRVLTNNHVVQNADRVKVTLADGRTFDAKVLGKDPKSDVAVVKIDAHGLPAATLGNSDALEVGEWVLAIGNPFELSQTVTAGIVSAKGRSSVGLTDYEDFIQTDAAINPGNSGGALVNLRGQVVGINTAIATRSGGYQGVGFAIPINMADKIMTNLVEHGRVIRGFMGVTLQHVDADIAETYGLDRPQGALVNSVTNGSPADEAGMQSGDLIVEMNGSPVTDRDELRLKIGEMSPGSTVELTVLRDDARKKVRVKLGEMPSDDKLAQSQGDERGGSSSLDKLGIEAQDLDRQMRAQFEIDADQDGVLVAQVSPGSPAFDAGLRQGDLIVEAGRVAVGSVAEFRQIVSKVAPGKTLLLKVYRDGVNRFQAMRIPSE